MGSYKVVARNEDGSSSIFIVHDMSSFNEAIDYTKNAMIDCGTQNPIVFGLVHPVKGDSDE
jgi:hypothetical protein